MSELQNGLGTWKKKKKDARDIDEQSLLFPGISHGDTGHGDLILLRKNSVPLSSLGCDWAGVGETGTPVIPRAGRGMSPSLTSWVLSIQKPQVFAKSQQDKSKLHTLCHLDPHSKSHVPIHIKNLAVKSRW